MNYISKGNRSRLMTVFVFVILAAIVLIARLGYVQVINTGKFKEGALNKGTRNIILKSQRGTIMDRNGMKMAFNNIDYEVWASPKGLKDEEKENVSKELSDILSIDISIIREKLMSKKELVKITSGINKATAEAAVNSGKGQLWTEAIIKREYPYNNFASYVIGHMNSDSSTGIAGLEQNYNTELGGKDGQLIVSTDASGRRLPYGKDDETPAQNGYNMVLTIDEVIQHFSEKALDETISKYGAKRGYAIVMDPNTGEVLSMAAKPDYNPNDPRDTSFFYKNLDFAKMSDEKQVENYSRMWRNPNISDAYEPGSTFKLLTVAAALAEGVVTPLTKFYDKGYIKVADQIINNWQNQATGWQTVTTAIDNSCNPVLVQIGHLMKISTFYDRFKAFGIMEKTNIDLPGESNSIHYKKADVGQVEAATMTFGHGISATPIQVVTSISSLVNGGKLLKPQIVKNIQGQDGKIVKEFKPQVIRTVLSEKVSDQMRTMMESVVLDGSGKRAKIPGIRVGGKTGTSIKFINGKYNMRKTYASFVGVAPIDDPKIIVLVVIDEPKGFIEGSFVAAPCAKTIMEDTLRYMRIEPAVKSSNKLKMPDVKGYSLEKASNILKALGIDVSVQPINYKNDIKRAVKSQYPIASKSVKKGDKAILYVK